MLVILMDILILVNAISSRTYLIPPNLNLPNGNSSERYGASQQVGEVALESENLANQCMETESATRNNNNVNGNKSTNASMVKSFSKERFVQTEQFKAEVYLKPCQTSILEIFSPKASFKDS